MFKHHFYLNRCFDITPTIAKELLLLLDNITKYKMLKFGYTDEDIEKLFSFKEQVKKYLYLFY